MIARRALFLVNPKASRAETGLDAVIRTLTDGGIEPVRPLNDDVDTLIRRHAAADDDAFDRGGDGTLNRAAPALMETGLPLAALGLLNPAIAGAAMALSSISVVANALLLRRWRPRT